MLVALMLAAPVYAEDAVPLFYTRTDIALVRQSAPALPWQAAGDKPTPAEVIFDTEIRDGATLYNQQGWYNLSGPSPTSAVMLVFGAPVLAPIIPSANYAVIDILLLDTQGTVVQIFPKLRLSNLQEEMYPAQPISAFLFLQGGACEKLSIAPGDYVNYKIFKRPPKILGVPQS